MCKRHLKKSVTRRDILKYTLAGAGIAALGPMGSRLPTATGAPILGLKRVLSIFCYGGYDGLNLLVPFTNNAYYNRRSTIAIQPGNVINIGSADYGLHPALVNIGAAFNNNEAAAFRLVGYPNANLSHFISQDVHSWAVRDEFDPLGVPVSGWVARYADNYAQTPTGAVSIGVGRPLEFEGGTTNPLTADSLNNFDFSDSSISSQDHAHRLQALGDTLASYSGSTLPTEARDALDSGVQLTDQIQTAVADYEATSPFEAQYPTSRPGRHIRDFATLINGGFDTEVCMTGFGGWDTHGNQGAEAGNQATLMTRMDQGIGTFIAECKALNVWNDMLILISTEFGRRNGENGSNGTDHGHGNMFFALGGNVTPGLYGPDVSETDISNQNWLHYELDYRDIFKEAVSNHLGEDPTPVFPEPQDINTTLNYI